MCRAASTASPAGCYLCLLFFTQMWVFTLLERHLKDTKVNATVVAREDVSASDADLDTIYYKLDSMVQVSIFLLWGKKV